MFDRREYAREYQKRNAARRRELARIRYWRDPERFRAKARREMKLYAGRNKPKKRAWHLRQFGLTPEQYAARLTQQNGVCAICGLAETKKWRENIKQLSVDHDHVTGTVRALLCQTCNQMIGFAQDDPVRLETAAAYLRLWAEIAA